MRKELSIAKREAQKAAKELFYNTFCPNVFDRIKLARNITEVINIMVDLRHQAEEVIW